MIESTNKFCCETQTVTDAEPSDLNGEYKLKVIMDEKADEICMDGCIYTKEGEDDDFCFAYHLLEKLPNIVCTATTQTSSHTERSSNSLRGNH